MPLTEEKGKGKFIDRFITFLLGWTEPFPQKGRIKDKEREERKSSWQWMEAYTV